MSTVYSNMQSSQSVKMYTLDYNPGVVPGHVVLKKNSPIIEYRQVEDGYEWVENDIGSWVGPQRIQVPKYKTEQVVVGYKVSWIVYTEDEFKKFQQSFS